MRRRTALLAALTLIAAGCGSGPAETGGSEQGEGVKFAECMRDNGVSGFPDPDASGRLTIDGVVNGSSLDPSSARWEQAMRACRDLQPAGFTGEKATSDEQETRLKFAQCMRENGVEDFPDPAPDAPLIDTNKIPSAAGRGARDIPGFDAAVHKCGDVYSGEPGLPER